MLYDLTNAQFLHMLKNMGPILDKAIQFAEAKKFDVNVLCHSRLAPDQFDFTRQIQIMCDTAKKCAAFLTGQDAPNQNDDEKTIVELKARIESVISYLSKFSERDYMDAASHRISQPRWEGKYLTGREYALHHAVPNFYFHMTTAYSILRHNGVDVGKKDFLGKLPFKS
jgi:hypothetical protein